MSLFKGTAHTPNESYCTHNRGMKGEVQANKLTN